MQTMTRSGPSGFLYVEGFLTDEEQQSLLHHLATLTFTHDIFRGKPMKRSELCQGFRYRAVGRRLEPADPFDEHCLLLTHKALPYCPDGTPFDQCIIQQYPEGAGIGWHTDAPVFGDVILGVSLGAEGRLQFRKDRNSSVCFEVAPASGSLYVMSGPARWGFQHRVVPVRALRYSLTFR